MGEPQTKLISPAILTLLDAARDPVRFVEIGANDGASFDPLAPYVRDRGWRGVMVEPVPHVFAELERNHGERPGLQLLNAAVGPEDGRREVHHLRPGVEDPDLPFWADAIGSFDREHVLAALGEVSDPEALITSTEVEVLSFETLRERCGIGALDLILIDAEGADVEILDSIDLRRHRPRVLVYEHHHLEPADRERCEARLATLGYTLYEEALDTWALDMTPEDALSDRWRRAIEASGRPS